MKTITLFAIANSINEGLRWNNMWGWVTQDDETEFAQYSKDEQADVTLPLEGYWVAVD